MQQDSTEIDRLRKALVICRDSIVHEENSGSIVDTIWIPHGAAIHETLFDFIEPILDGSRDPKFVKLLDQPIDLLPKQKILNQASEFDGDPERLGDLKFAVRKASGPSIDLDIQIRDSLLQTEVCQSLSSDKLARLFGHSDASSSPFTSSIDASISLIEGLLPDWLWMVSRGVIVPSGNGPYWTSMYTLEDPTMPIENGLDPGWGEGFDFPGRTACLSVLNGLISTLHALCGDGGRGRG